MTDRTCEQCGADISGLHGNALRCEECRGRIRIRGGGESRRHRCRGRGTCYCDERALAALSNLSAAEVAKVFGIDEGTVRNWRFYHGLSAPPQTCSAAIKYGTNRNFFTSIDTPGKAYVLGFVVADGCVHPGGGTVTIALKESDAGILKAIAEETGCDGPLRRRVCDGGAGFGPSIQVCLELHGTQLVRDLATLGVHPNKTRTATFPTVPPKYERHMVRGLFDGDGWIGKRAFSLIGTDAVVEGAADAIERHTGFRLRYHRDKGFLVAQGARRDRPVVRWMYQDAPIALDRKAEAYRLYWA